MCFYRGIVVKDSFPCLKKKKQEMMIKDFFFFLVMIWVNGQNEKDVIKADGDRFPERERHVAVPASLLLTVDKAFIHAAAHHIVLLLHHIVQNMNYETSGAVGDHCVLGLNLEQG